MKIAIHHRPGSFSDRWIAYCKKENIDYKIVNAFDSNIIEQVLDCDAFMWHYHPSIIKDTLIARRILFALEHAEVKVFPDWKTAWHFDDKVAQKYLLEAIDIPMVPSYVFYDKQKALDWIEQTSFPKVWKLKGGAGSQNVELIPSKTKARRYIKKAFGKGFLQFNKKTYLKERIYRFRSGKENFMGVLKGLGRLVIPTQYSRLKDRERNYIYLQDFIPDLDFDVRVQVIGERVFGLKRFVRRNDFRASGSGNFIEFNPNNVDLKLLRIAFKIAQKIQSQSLTLDFIYQNGKPLVVEMSYGFPMSFYDNCQGYWDKELNWHEESFISQYWMVEDLLREK